MSSLIQRVAVANRGEIASRVFATCRRLGIESQALYSDPDAALPYVDEADVATRLPGSTPTETYLDAERVIHSIRAVGGQSVHPGYGFLSENADFARAVQDAGLIWLGPPPDAIEAMGSKIRAKDLMRAAGVPVLEAPDQPTEADLPLLVKASAGGGGRGMRVVRRLEDLDAEIESARAEAASAFGGGTVFVEPYVESGRHVEVQILFDTHGNGLAVGDRDCSLQRRHQKVLEEAPAPGLPPEMRAVMGRAAVEAAKAVGYVGAGTVEFIADGRDGLRPDRFFFMEMNTRLQVEHPVTEAITGLDLVELQFRVASGEPLPFVQDDLAIRGHAVEARIYAEDPAHGFLPSTGKLWALELPGGEGIRVDAGVRADDVVTPFYDPMIAKVIAHGDTRDEALDRLSAALGRTLIAGPRTNVAFLRALCDAPGFREGRFDTGFIDRDLPALTGADEPHNPEAVAAGVLKLVEGEERATNPSALGGARRGNAAWTEDPWRVSDGFQLSGPRRSAVAIVVDSERLEVDLVWSADGAVAVAIPSLDYLGQPDFDWDEATGNDTFDEGRGQLIVAAGDVLVLHEGRQIRVAAFDPFDVDLEHIGEGGVVKAPMHGKVVAIFVQPGERVKKGQRLAIVEAMKMEHALVAPSDGEVTEVMAAAGQQVAEGARLITLQSDEAAPT